MATARSPVVVLGADLGGAQLGIAATAGYAAYQAWPVLVPAWASTGGVVTTEIIGGLAGLYPAWRAARLAPTEAW